MIQARLEPPMRAEGVVIFLALIFMVGTASYFAGMSNTLRFPGRTMPVESLQVMQIRLEARLTGLLKHCIKNDTVQRFKPGCEELAQYVTQQADAAEAREQITH